MKSTKQGQKENSREDQGKVPDDFPEMKCVSRIWSEEGRPYMPYYKAEDVWKYFKKIRPKIDDELST